MPKEFSDIKECFETFYKSKHPKHDLKWLYGLGTVHVRSCNKLLCAIRSLTSFSSCHTYAPVFFVFFISFFCFCDCVIVVTHFQLSLQIVMHNQTKTNFLITTTLQAFVLSLFNDSTRPPSLSYDQICAELRLPHKTMAKSLLRSLSCGKWKVKMIEGFKSCV